MASISNTANLRAQIPANLQNAGNVQAQGTQPGLHQRQINAAQPGPARASTMQRIGQAVRHTFQQITSGSARAQHAQQRATTSFNTQIGATLDTLRAMGTANARQSSGQAAQLWVDLHSLSMAQSTLDTRGGDAQQTLNATLSQHLKTLPHSELMALAKGLAHGDLALVQNNLSAHPQAETLLMMIGTAVQQALNDVVSTNIRTRTDSAVDAAIVAIASDAPKEKVASHIQASFFPAANELGQLSSAGLSTFTKDQLDRESALAIQNSLSAYTQAEITAFLERTPTDELKRLSLPGSAGPIHADISAEISQRTQRLVAQLDADTTTFLSRDPALVTTDPDGPGHDPAGNITLMTGLTDAIHQLRAHCQTHGLVYPPRADELLAQIIDHGERLLQGNNVSLHMLDNAEIGVLKAITQRLYIESPQAHIANEASTRLAPLATQYQQDTQALLTGLLNNDPQATLDGLKAMHTSFTTLRTAQHDLHRDMNGAPEVARLRNTHTQTVLQAQSDAQLMQLASALLHPDAAALQEGLLSTSDALYASGQDMEGVKLGTMAGYFEETLGQVVAELKQRGINLPTDPNTGRLLTPNSDAGAASLDDLSPAMKQAFSQVFSVTLSSAGSEVTRGALSPTLHATLEQQLQGISQETRVLPGGTLVSAQFVKDALRQFPIMIGNHSLIDYSQWSSLSETQKLQRIEQGMQTLIAGCGGDTNRALLLSQIAHQGVSAAFLNTTYAHADEALVHLPDGRAGLVRPRAPSQNPADQTVQLRFVTNSGGELELEVSETIHGGVMNLFEASSDNSMVAWLDESSRFSYRFQASIDNNGQLTVSEAPTYDFSLRASALQKPYLAPQLNDLLNTHPRSELAQDFNTYADKNGAPGALKARQQLDKLTTQPTVGGLQQFVATYLTPGAPAYQPALQASGAAFQQALSGHENQVMGPVLEILAAQRETVIGLINRTDYQNAVKKGVATLPGWPAGFAAPNSFADLLKSGNTQAINALLDYVDQPDHAPENAHYLRELAQLEQNPTLANAQTLYQRFFVPPQPVPGLSSFEQPKDDNINIASTERDKVRMAMEQAQATPISLAGLPPLHTPLDAQLSSLLPGFTQAAIDGTL